MAESDGAKIADEKPESTEASASPMLGLKAVLVGATGAIGECLLGEVLASKNFAQVVVLGRRNATVPESYGVDQKAEEESGRLQQHTVDFDNLSTETVGEFFTDKQAFFCTLGTTRKQAGSAAAFRHIDYDYVVNCAEVAKKCNVPYVAYVSSVGANANSWFLYPEVKGKVEEALKKLNFARTSIYRPGLLERGEKLRPLEKLATWIVSSMPVATVAKAIRVEAETHFTGQQSSEKGAEGAQESVTLNFDADIRKIADPEKKKKCSK